MSDLRFRKACSEDLPRLQEIRERAFAAVFASFREILGSTIYGLAQAPEDEAQAGYLDSLFDPKSEWSVFLVSEDGLTIGFVSVRLDHPKGCGEIGLNAVDPDHAGRGIGTRMYEYTLDLMRKDGLKVATVATGGDPSHGPARRAYRKAGFDVEIPSVWMCREL